MERQNSEIGDEFSAEEQHTAAEKPGKKVAHKHKIFSCGSKARENKENYSWGREKLVYCLQKLIRQLGRKVLGNGYK